MIKLITDNQGRQIAVLQRDTHLSKWVEETRELCHDRTVYEKITPLIKPGDVVVDVGANIGDHTIAYAQAVGPTGRVYAYEPNGLPFACLAINMSYFPQVRPFYFGLGDREEVVFMQIDPDNVGASYMTDERRLTLYPTLVMPLDRFAFDRLNFMKIDVEGWEPFVLKGARQTIAKHRPIVLCELNAGALLRNGNTVDTVVRFMAGLNYELRFLDPAHDLRMPMVDVLFMPR